MGQVLRQSQSSGRLGAAPGRIWPDCKILLRWHRKCKWSSELRPSRSCKRDIESHAWPPWAPCNFFWQSHNPCLDPRISDWPARNVLFWCHATFKSKSYELIVGLVPSGIFQKREGYSRICRIFGVNRAGHGLILENAFFPMGQSSSITTLRKKRFLIKRNFGHFYQLNLSGFEQTIPDLQALPLPNPDKQNEPGPLATPLGSPSC